ncbi:MAG: ribosomal protein S18-alanine N-acetyltransferase [Anaerolineaceae bacterium]|nr:ribosomal protein S18-alanine N-acetyltransferase [Anaerolineaceae bacterium]MBN2676969.1 ribosomal protein S18-alanine N-acetyltransferase [Anaerolineaceae bacterium]
MTLNDVNVVHALDVASFSLPWPERAYKFEVSQNPNSLPLVIELKDDKSGWVIAGVLVIWLILDEAHIGTIAIDAGKRRLGLAKRLLVEGLLMSSSEGAKTAYLEVRRGNLTAQELYRQFGFTIEGIRPRYYKDNNEDALLLTLKSLDTDRLNELLV